MNGKEKTAKITEMKGKEKIAMLTSYDFVTATLLHEAQIDMILVGDSVGNVLLGYENTLPVTMEEMLHHVRAVARAKPACLLVADMPNKSYTDKKTGLENAKKFLEAGAEAVKVEGAVIEVARHLVQNGVPVMGHVGLTPQTITEWKVQGKDEQSAQKILRDAIALEKSGCFSMVIETVPAELGKKITEKLGIPTIGIGAGIDCDGQVLVINDLLGFNAREFKPRFVKSYANLREEALKAIRKFHEDLKKGAFPKPENSYK